MIEALEEDSLDEFRGGTLAINAGEDKTVSKHPEATDVPEKAPENQRWGAANFISIIPSKISGTLWSSNQPDKEKTKEKNIPANNQKIQPSLQLAENPENYFTARESVLARALSECKEQFLDEEHDGPLLDAFLLTQISNWNSDKERLLLLTPRSLVIAKYDFIALKRLGYKKLPLDIIEEVVVGDLVYPNGSLIPRMNGLVEGLSQILETCVFARWSKPDNKDIGPLFQSRNRNMQGMRLTWDKNKPIPLTSQWNPFNEDYPFFTFTFHPLFFNKDCDSEKLKNLYNLDVFVEKLCKAITELPKYNNPETKACTIQTKEIILWNYLGLASIIHNRNSLGFFKVRGRFSF